MVVDRNAARSRALGPAAVAAVGTHLLVVVLVLVHLAYAETGPQLDANIGSGLAQLTLLALGLPWSAAFLAGVLGGATDTGQVAAYTAVCLGNVVLHAALWFALSGRPVRSPFSR